MGRLFMVENGQSLMCRAASEFDKSIFMVVLFDMCGVIGFTSRPIFDHRLCRLLVAFDVIRRILAVSSKVATEESKLSPAQ